MSMDFSSFAPTLAKPGLLVMDVDATLIEEEVIDLLGAESGCGDEMSLITARAMRGEITFDDSLRLRVKMLRNLNIDECKKHIIPKIHVTKGANVLIDELHAHGWKVGAVSGGFHEILDELLPSLNIDFWVAHHLESIDGKLTGNVLGNIVNASAKVEALRAWASDLGVEREQTVVVGDGANDISMIKFAGLGVAFCAKPAVQAATPYHILTRDLSAVLRFLNAN
ncbi:phosphoserine phosphatase SerB [Gardnerella sp. Marseille-QA0894]|uniref:phosphoserine phosphatase SerB n=1 Tax=Gardnerella sp. Marseille-QA0894 TaxID=3383031 RepID=UPI003AF4BCD6